MINGQELGRARFDYKEGAQRKLERWLNYSVYGGAYINLCMLKLMDNNKEDFIVCNFLNCKATLCLLAKTFQQGDLEGCDKADSSCSRTSLGPHLWPSSINVNISFSSCLLTYQFPLPLLSISSHTSCLIIILKEFSCLVKRTSGRGHKNKERLRAQQS